MPDELNLLLIAAITVSFLHTVSGPDHYIPFIALSKSRGWSMSKTMMWTAVCGTGHVLSSVLLGLVGAAIGWSLSNITAFQGIRGNLASWALLLFGLIYFVYGIFRSVENRRHKHFELIDETLYVHEHRHGEATQKPKRHAVSPWVMFLIFVLGPCEPMIPLLYAPGASGSTQALVILITVYTLFTISTMMLMVLFGLYSMRLFRFEKIERYMHAMAGLTILICGIGMVYLDW